MVNTKGELNFLLRCRQMGILVKYLSRNVASVVQIYLHQLMKCSIAAIGQCGKHCVTLNNKGIVSEILTHGGTKVFYRSLKKAFCYVTSEVQVLSLQLVSSIRVDK